MRRLIPLLLFVSAPAFAHDGLHAGWTLDLWVTGPLLISVLLYAVGFSRLWARSDQGRSVLRRNAALFGTGWLILAGALVSPLHEAGERSFTMHMIEHEAIMLPAALLLVAARPGGAMLWALPAFARALFGAAARSGKSLWRATTDPVAATVLQAVVMCVWHAPALFDRALDNRAWHVAQHLSFLVTSLIFWWAMAHGRNGGRGYGVAALCLFVTSMVGGGLGALMTFSASPWYQGYAALGMTPFGLTPSEDQQVAGLLMWIPGGLFHAGAALYFLFKWLGASEVRHAVSAR